jgi:hypothetical protein
MKKIFFIIILFATISTAFAQKKEKVKGSKIVTTEIKKIESFNSLEVGDDIEVLLIKGAECGLEIEADDNLHEAIEMNVVGNTLKLFSTKNVISSKKFSVKVTYVDDFKSIVTKNDSKVIALSDFELDAMDIKTFDSSKLQMNAKVKNFTLVQDDKSKSELNLKAENTKISLTKSASAKALINSTDLTFDMYQKSEAIIEGEVQNVKLRLDNNAAFTGKKLVTKTAEITTESYTNASLQILNSVIIEATAKSEIELYGDQKIEIRKFTDSAVLKKKPVK